LLAFTGDLMLSGGRLHNWFDSEWDYGFAKAIYALHSSAALVERFEPRRLCPSHGDIVDQPVPELKRFREKLRVLEPHYLRGYPLWKWDGAEQDTVSRPTAVPHVWQITPHLFKFKGPDFWPNFTLLMADNGHGLVVDCGLFDKTFLQNALEGMRDRLGLKKIDAVIVTHYHGDHCLEVPFLREKWGAEVWTLDRVVQRMEAPERFDLAAPINTYGHGIDTVPVQRVLRDGETFQWQGYTLTADWMPGQTEYALCLHGEIDGRRVAFTGDNLFASSTDPAQNGHEAVVARNSGILEAGYLYAAEYLHGLQPDLIVGGHSWVMDRPRDLIERYRRGALALRAAFRDLSSEDDYRYWFDPFWVRAEPFRLQIAPGEVGEATLLLRNFGTQRERFRVELRPAEGVRVDPTVVEAVVPADSVGRFPLRLAAASGAAPGPHIVAFGVTRGGHRYGEWFDMLVAVAAAPDAGGAQG
jgi:glyoxylase-like metal-dependent hydrolase (beta-lactamase superfamily II)